ANPYVSLTGCASGGNMASPALDVWYSFTTTGTLANITISGFPNASIGFWTGTCNGTGLTGLSCTNLGATGNGTLSIPSLTIGQVYYIQISGNNGSATDNNFSIAVDNDIDCNDCLRGTTLTTTPAPVNGTYAPGQVVRFCYTVTDWTQVSANWLHGIQISFGPGWTGISNATPPAACQGSGTWAYFPTGVGVVNGTNWGTGFYFDTIDGGASPINNYGDNCTGGWTFCWDMTVSSTCVAGQNLSVSVNTSADGESGSWTSPACQSDPPSLFSAVKVSGPVMTSANAVNICSGQSVNLALTADQPSTFVWVAAANGNVTGESTTNQTSNTINNVLVNTTASPQVVVYTVTPTSIATGCPGTPQTVNVTVYPTPTVNAGADVPVCAGSCINLSGTSSIAPGTFATTFNNPADVNIPNNNTGGVNTTVTSSGIINSNSTIGSICFDLTHTNYPDIGQNGNANAITITMPDGTVYNSTLTPLAAGSGPRTYCIPPAVYAGYTGTLNGTFTLNVKDTRGGGGGTGAITNFTVVINTNTVQWSPTTNMTNSNTLTPTVCPTVNTTYTLTVISPGGCIASDAVNVTVSPAPTMVLSSGSATQTTCVNVAITPIQFTVGGGATGATISVGSLPPGVSGNFAAGVITISGIPTLAGTYNYTVSTTGGCSAPVTISGTITVTGAIVPVTGFSYTTPVCSNNANILPALVPGFTSGGTFSALPAGLTINPSTGEITVSSSTPGAYTVTYNFPASACGLAASSNAPITITLLPTATISYAGTPFCTSLGSAQAVTITGTGAYTGGTYTSAPAGLSINAATGAVTPSTSTAGTYTITYTIPASGGCPAIPVTTTVVITQLP
ncbi:MAG: PKD-like domain-containing protein, partial [Bacteroidia bacterium]